MNGIHDDLGFTPSMIILEAIVLLSLADLLEGRLPEGDFEDVPPPHHINCRCVLLGEGERA